jgi:diketogulonate reductase-like aldo/keto reductase
VFAGLHRLFSFAGIAVNPQSTDPKYIGQDLDLFGFELSAAEISVLNAWKPERTSTFETA